MHRLVGKTTSRSSQRIWLSQPKRCLSARRHTFCKGDNIWLYPLGGTRPHWRTLDGDQRVYTSSGAVSSDNIIGAKSGDLVRASNGDHVRLEVPTLAEHISFTGRLVTPIYPVDAVDIVSLLDLHVPSLEQTDSAGPELEILEAGTGHGALALYLAQRLQAANPAVPTDVLEDARLEAQGASEPLEALKAWRDRRNAVLHTLEIRADVSKHARKVIGSFRGAMYTPHIDMHIGSVGDWLTERLEAQESGGEGIGRSFLQHIILDLPDVSGQLDVATQALHPGGTILTFCPSISQIEHLVLLLREMQLPLVLDRVVELSNSTNGGREWDVRLAEIRASSERSRKAITPSDINDDAPSSVEDSEDNHSNFGSSEEASQAGLADGPALDRSDTHREIRSPQVFAAGSVQLGMVARPKATNLHVRSAFVGVFRKRWPDETGKALKRDEWRGSANKKKQDQTRKLHSRKPRKSSD